MTECPTCHRPFERAGRMCASCNKPIKRRHKWHTDGYVNRHDDCSNPEMNPPEIEPLLRGSETETQD